MNIILMGLPGAGKRYSSRKNRCYIRNSHIFQQEICSGAAMQQETELGS